MIIKNPTIIIKGKGGETLGGEYNIEQIVDGDNCELVVTTATGVSKPKLQEKTANPTTTTQIVTPDENYDGLSSVEILAVDNSIDDNIKAENIKKDITILGVTGTLESQTSTPNLQRKNISPTQESQRVVPDSGYDGLSEVLVYGDGNLSPEYIRYGHDIFGVVGEYAGVGPQIIDKTIEEINPDILGGVSAIGDYVFYKCTDLTSVFLENSNITSIGEYAFAECTMLGDVTISTTLTHVDNSAFRSCIGLGVYFPIDPETGESVCNIETIGEYAFYKIASFIGIDGTPPLRNIISIGRNAFYQCGQLDNIILGENLQSIGASAFYGCSNLTEMTILATTPPTLSNKNAISSATTTIYIPAGTLSAYQSATNWSNFASKFVELDDDNGGEEEQG